jgi:hypothetical protein
LGRAREQGIGSFLQSRREEYVLVPFGYCIWLTQYSSWSDASRPSFSSQVDGAIVNAGDLIPSQDIEDPDGWLNVNAEDLDPKLQESMSHEVSHTSHEMGVDPDLENEERDTTHAQVTKLRDLAKKVDAFVAGKGDVEGATFEEQVVDFRLLPCSHRHVFPVSDPMGTNERFQRRRVLRSRL